jgi:hypothetical protein
MVDEPVTSQKQHVSSFPCKRESSLFRYYTALWIPAFAGMTTFYETVIVDVEIFSILFLPSFLPIFRMVLPFLFHILYAELS